MKEMSVKGMVSCIGTENEEFSKYMIVWSTGDGSYLFDCGITNVDQAHHIAGLEHHTAAQLVEVLQVMGNEYWHHLSGHEVDMKNAINTGLELRKLRNPDSLLEEHSDSSHI